MSDPSGMSSRSCVFSLLKVGFRWRACQCRRLPSAFETSGPLAKNLFSSGFIAGHRQDHPAVVGGILDSSGSTAIFAGLEFIFARLEFAGLLYPACFVGKRPGNTSHRFDCPRSIHRPGMGPASGGIHPQKLPLIPPPPPSHH
jgi:hypothetical protein